MLSMYADSYGWWAMGKLTFLEIVVNDAGLLDIWAFWLFFRILADDHKCIGAFKSYNKGCSKDCKTFIGLVEWALFIDDSRIPG